MVNNSPVAVAIVSTHAIAREGLRRVLEVGGLTVVETHASSRGLASSQERRKTPSIVILDKGTDQPSVPEIEACQHAAPDAKLVVLADHFDFDMMLEAFNAGVEAYILKRIDCDALIGSLKLVHLGEKVMPSELASCLPARWSGRVSSTMPEYERISLLSEREIETLRHLIDGSPNKVIAAHLEISEATVKVHVKAILRKLGVQNRTQAAIWAVNNGIELNRTDVLAATQAETANSEKEIDTVIAR